jgi:hypothetical protein
LLTAESEVTRVLLSKENLFVFTAITIEHFKLNVGAFTLENLGRHVLGLNEEVSEAVCIKDEIWLGSKTLQILSVTDAANGWLTLCKSAVNSKKMTITDVQPKTFVEKIASFSIFKSQHTQI